MASMMSLLGAFFFTVIVGFFKAICYLSGVLSVGKIIMDLQAGLFVDLLGMVVLLYAAMP
jgi:hypothetical protein